MKLSYTHKAVLYLHDHRGDWILGASLIKLNSSRGFIGPSIDRSMRFLMEDIAETGYCVIGNTKYYVEKRENKGKVEYRVPFAEKPQQIIEELMVDGVPRVRISQSVLGV